MYSKARVGCCVCSCVDDRSDTVMFEDLCCTMEDERRFHEECIRLLGSYAYVYHECGVEGDPARWG